MKAQTVNAVSGVHVDANPASIAAITSDQMVELEVKCHKLDSSINVWFIPDTGAEIDAIPYKNFHEGYPGVKLQHANAAHTATGAPIRNEGKLPATLERR